MQAKWFLFLCVFVITAVSAYAQTRTVTNMDLEKYRQQRLKAEQDLNENYKALGFPSPEERARRLEAWKKDNRELAERLRRERLEQENADAATRQAEAAQEQYSEPAAQSYPVYGGGVLYPYGYQDPFWFHHRFRFRPFGQQPLGFFAGGAFWPAPSPVRIPILARPFPGMPRP